MRINVEAHCRTIGILVRGSNKFAVAAGIDYGPSLLETDFSDLVMGVPSE
jgi:hypothetical protein